MYVSIGHVNLTLGRKATDISPIRNEANPLTVDFRTRNARLTMDKVAKRLSERLGRAVTKLDVVAGPYAKAAAEKLQGGEVLLHRTFDPAGGGERCAPCTASRDWGRSG